MKISRFAVQVFQMAAVFTVLSTAAHATEIYGRLTDIGQTAGTVGQSPYYVREKLQDASGSWQVIPANWAVRDSLNSLASVVPMGEETPYNICVQGKIIQKDEDKGLFVFEAESVEQGECPNQR